LNWLNHYEQFFRDQRTAASNRTWLALYHLIGAAQTWYYAFEQDEGRLERCSQELWYNCDEPYEGHQCQRLFYLESANYIDYGSQSDIMDAAAPPKETIA
jgi:hypothetical protein